MHACVRAMVCDNAREASVDLISGFARRSAGGVLGDAERVLGLKVFWIDPEGVFEGANGFLESFEGV